MALPEIEEEARQKRTKLLLVGGALSLLLPLMGAMYLRWRDASTVKGPSGRHDLFESREGLERKITPSYTAVPPSAIVGNSAPAPLPPGQVSAKPTGSSIDFIQANSELRGKTELSKPADPAPPAAPAPAPAPTAPVEPPKDVAKSAKKGKKPFEMPKLQPTRGFTSFKGGMRGGKGGSAPGAVDTSPTNSEMSDMLKNLPPGSENNPEIQKYLQQYKK